MLEQQDNTQNTGIGEPAEPLTAPRTPAKTTPRQFQRRELPQYRVVLHNDDLNEIPFVVRTVLRITPLNRMRATLVTLHAHYHGEALVLITHRERAELYQTQFRGRGLIVTIEPDA
jgi:ATP-dependent Clp protease adaptor protein ClpS